MDQIYKNYTYIRPSEL